MNLLQEAYRQSDQNVRTWEILYRDKIGNT